jgi:hypothetical protein
MALCDFWFFLRLEITFQRNRFDDIDIIKQNTTKHLRSTPEGSFKNVSNKGRNASINVTFRRSLF